MGLAWRAIQGDRRPCQPWFETIRNNWEIGPQESLSNLSLIL